MKKSILLVFAALSVFSVHAFGHQPFTLVSSEKKTIKPDDLIKIEKENAFGKKDGTTLTFTEKQIRLVIVTGPEDDMLSFRIQGIRNPTLVVSSGATLRVLFVNSDEDMKHDIRFGHVMGEFMANPSVAGTVGADKLAQKTEAVMNAEDFVIKASEDGLYKYFCSVGNHAKGGMWGNIAVGVKPGANMKMPEKTTHVHSADEDKMEDMPGMKPAEKMPEKKPGEMSDMPGMKKDDMPTTSPTPSVIDTTSQPEESDYPIERSTSDMLKQMPMRMPSTVNIGDPMKRESSGTSWNADSPPMYAKMKMASGGMWMFMGTAFLRYTDVDSDRDVSVAGKGSRSRADAPTMFMAMYSHPIGEKAQFGFRSMLSLDPVIERGYGYPLLYQSGETYRGQPIHDRQHPHDLFSELAVTWSYKFNDKRSFYIYAGYPGEPALGPPMYLHRSSGMNNPDAPIGHHWQDSTHITFGVLTAGYSFGKVKLEASAFNGTEPNDNRWNFDKPRLNSFSGRLSFNPTENWALQISHGYLKDPERSEPDVHILRRTTASAIYNKKFDDEHNWATSIVFGRNDANREATHSFLAETNYDFKANAVFGRFESVQKSGHDLVLAAPLENSIFHLNVLSVGYIRDLIHNKGIDVGLGGKLTADFNPSSLAPYYGGTSHTGWQVFMRFRPSKM
jgi:plastocyanin